MDASKAWGTPVCWHNCKWNASSRKIRYSNNHQCALITATIAAAFSWFSIENDPWSTYACWMSALLFALTAISLAAQQSIGLNRLYSCEDGLLKIRLVLGELNPRYEERTPRTHREDHNDADARIRMRRSQLWMWQAPIMLLNFSILLFIIGLMLSIFVRAVASTGGLSSPEIKVRFLLSYGLYSR